MENVMKSLFRSLAGETAAKQQPQERIDTFKLLLGQMASVVKSEGSAGRGPSVSVIPHILNRIIQLLLEEERETQGGMEGTAPCIEHFLQSRYLEYMCKLAINNRPIGIYQWIINAISRIIQHMKSTLIAHSSIHKPIVRLLSLKPNNLTFEEKSEVLRLVTSLSNKLKEEPIFGKLFWTTPDMSKHHTPISADSRTASQPIKISQPLTTSSTQVTSSSSSSYSTSSSLFSSSYPSPPNSIQYGQSSPPKSTSHLSDYGRQENNSSIMTSKIDLKSAVSEHHQLSSSSNLNTSLSSSGNGGGLSNSTSPPPTSTSVQSHFVLFKILDRIYRASGDRRLTEQVRRCILNCIVIDDFYTELMMYLATQTKFMDFTMSQLGMTYAQLARETHSGTQSSNSILQEFFRQIQFCTALCKVDYTKLSSSSALTSISSDNSISNGSLNFRIEPQVADIPPIFQFAHQMSESMKRSFLIPILIPALMSEDPRLANIHTIFTRETILQLDSPELLGALISCLIGPSSISSGGRSVQDTLVSRLEFHHHQLQGPLDSAAKKIATLSCNTMRLFSSLCQFHPHNLYITRNLIFKNLPLIANPNAHYRVYKHSDEDGHDGIPLDPTWKLLPEVIEADRAISDLKRPDNIGERIESLLFASPLVLQLRDTGSRPDVQTYHDYTKLKFKSSRAHLLTWSSHPSTPERKFPPPFPSEFVSHPLQAISSISDIDLEAQSVAKWIILPPIANDDEFGKPVELHTLTSILQYPHMFIHTWSYHHGNMEHLDNSSSSKPGNAECHVVNQEGNKSSIPCKDSPSIVDCLISQCSKAKSMIDSHPALLNKIIDFKTAAESKQLPSGQFDLTDDERNAHAILMLDEFCKEVLATLTFLDQVLH